MKPTRPITLAAAFLALTASTLTARGVRIWSYQELLDKSDVVVIATPTGTTDASEHIDLPGFQGQHVVGVETKFSVSTVLKGNPVSATENPWSLRPARSGAWGRARRAS